MTTGPVEDPVVVSPRHREVGLKEQLAREESYDKAAAALAHKRAAE